LSIDLYPLGNLGQLKRIDRLEIGDLSLIQYSFLRRRRHNSKNKTGNWKTSWLIINKHGQGFEFGEGRVGVLGFGHFLGRFLH